MNEKIFRILKIFVCCEIVFFLFFLAAAVNEHKIGKKIRKGDDIKILFLSTTDKNFNGAYILDYSIQKQIMSIFPISSNTRFIKNAAAKPVYLQDIYQRIYYSKKKNQRLCTEKFLKVINEYYDVKIDYFVEFSSTDIENVNKILKLDLSYSDIVNPNAEDYSIFCKSVNMKKFLDQLNVFEVLRIFRYDFYEKLRDVNYQMEIKNSNLTMIDIFYVLNTFYSLKSLKFVFVGFNNILYGDERFYIKNRLAASLDKAKENIVVEVLNASGKRGLALAVTRFLRDNKVDVQQWRNNGTVNDYSLVIDRSGSWANANMVQKILKNGIVFSKEDRDSFVDVTVVLGKDFKN